MVPSYLVWLTFQDLLGIFPFHYYQIILDGEPGLNRFLGILANFKTYWIIEGKMGLLLLSGTILRKGILEFLTLLHIF